MKKHFFFVLSYLLIVSCRPTDPPQEVKPKIISFEPTSGLVNAKVVIKGENLSKVTSVRFASVEAGFKSLGSEIEATVPEGATTGKITIIWPSGQMESANTFTVLPPPPVISELLPADNTEQGPVLIKGVNLENIVSIKFGNISAAIDTNITGIVTTRVPKGLQPGVVNVVVTNANGTSNNLPFILLRERPPGPKSPPKIIIRKRALYIPRIANIWRNDYSDSDTTHVVQLNFDRTGTEKFTSQDGFSIEYPITVTDFNESNKTIELSIKRGLVTEKYKGEYVEIEPTENNRQRIILYSSQGRQLVISVELQ